MANMFRCTLASGEALVFTVTCDSAFAGQTITCTDGTTTLTQICPSTSPYTVEFRIPNAGIWTISSGTTSTSVTIPSSTELHGIPNGSTITPTDDIQIWLHCANIWDKAYTTISQVLPDASTLQALIASNNAADYMARSTTWATDVCADSTAMSLIGLDDYCVKTLLADTVWLASICNSAYLENVFNVKVPAMTSATTPSGVVSASSVQSGFDAYKAFDGSVSTSWISSQGSGSRYVQYQFTNSVIINCVKYLINKNIGNPLAVNVTISASDNGTDWNELLTENETSTSIQKWQSYPIQSNTPYKYYRLTLSGATYRTNDNHYYGNCIELQFYGRE